MIHHSKLAEKGYTACFVGMLKETKVLIMYIKGIV